MTGYALATALAAPVEDGMMLAEAARPARQSAPFIELSTTTWEAVAACTVVMRPCLMPNFSLITLTIGARPLVVHEAHETTGIDAGSYSSVLTPTTMVGVSASLAGAEMMTFFAPPSMCFMHAEVSRKAPVGSRVAVRVTSSPSMRRPDSVASTVPGKRPCTMSCSRRYFMYSGVIGELMCLSTNASRSMAMRTTWRPMRPKPFTPSLMGASALRDILMGAARPEVAATKESAMIVL